MRSLLLVGLVGLVGCVGGDSPQEEPSDSGQPGGPGETAEGAAWTVEVHVTVDGAAEVGVSVMQAGTESVVLTNAEGVATLTLDRSVPGDLWVVAAATGAWNGGVEVEGPGRIEVELARFDPTDNPEYVFADPGAKADADTSSRECGHCHLTLHRGWSASPHRIAASDTEVHAVYQGVDLAADIAACAERAGTWGGATIPGSATEAEACFVASGVESATGGFGACADCHAPGIGGVSLGGHDLLEAVGVAYESGVHCDVCHKVRSVDLEAEAGVAGRLDILRPSDPSTSFLMGPWHPLMFGPYIDVVNPAMGATASGLLHESAFCAGCHELNQPVLVRGEAADPQRWPTGRLPVQSTYSEWEAGPMNPAAPCQSCHMPPAPEVGNSADLWNEFPDLTPGVAGGWLRPPGAVRAHTWVGPSDAASGMLELAAFVEVESETVDGELVAAVTVSNVGPGHAIPTGEPLRNLVLTVEATCDGVALTPTAGDVVPDFGGSLAIRTAPDSLGVFPEAAVGDRVRYARSLGWVDYPGPGVFGDGTFDAQAKGLPQLDFVGEAEVLAVATDGTLTLDHPEFAEAADTAFLVSQSSESALAGHPGFGFARVLVGADGERMVPHHLAVDVALDNRILPAASFTTTHRFAATCAAPEVHATLLYRAWPWAQAQRYGWALEDRVMAEAWR